MSTEEWISKAKVYWPSPPWNREQENEMIKFMDSMTDADRDIAWHLCVRKFRLRPLVADLNKVIEDEHERNFKAVQDTSEEDCFYCRGNGWVDHPRRSNTAIRCPLCHPRDIS